MPKKISNLLEELFAVTEEDYRPDSRFKSWAKRIDSVNINKVDGYAFKGPFINEGTSEYEVKSAVYMTAITMGSNKYQTTYYSVIGMTGNGELYHTGIETDNKTPGWALRIRDQIAELLEELNDVEVPWTAERYLSELYQMLHSNTGFYMATPPEIRELVEAWYDGQ